MSAMTMKKLSLLAGPLPCLVGARARRPFIPHNAFWQ